MPSDLLTAKDSIEILHATTPEHFAVVRVLLREYKESVGADLCFPAFEEELARLPGEYAPPHGRLLLAVRAGVGPVSPLPDEFVAGCAAVRPLTETNSHQNSKDRWRAEARRYEFCEMKRLFVRPAFRAQRVGRLLAEAVVAEARAIGYARMRLDTLPTMTAARALYASLGFREIPPYCFNPVEGTSFFELDL